MEAYLHWTDEKGTSRTLRLTDRIYIGRKCQGVPEDRKIIVCDPHVSKDHAVLTCSGEKIIVYDMSRNGTFINGSRVSPGVEETIRDGDELKVGDCTLRLEVKDLPHALGRQGSVEETMTVSSQIIITNLVGDVRGYTAYSQKLESAAVYEAMKAIFDDFSTVVQKWKGLVKDYAGDAIFAVWEHGAQGDPEKAEQACRAAMEQYRILEGIVEKIADAHEGFRHLQMGWGITTGAVTLSHYGVRKDYMAIVGDSTNLAFRLSKQANKNLDSTIVICQSTAEILAGRLPLKEIGEVATEGRVGMEKVFGLVL